MTEQRGYVSPPPMSLVRWQEKYAALREVLEAYAGLPADDRPGRPSAALGEYLAVMAFADPEAPALAAAQLRALADRDVRTAEQGIAVGLLPWPELTDPWSWMGVVADLLAQSADAATPARTGAPGTPWAWRRSFPRLHQLFAGYFGQDFPDEYPDLDPAEAERAAVLDWRSGTTLAVHARTVGELSELLALRLDRADLELALGALGRDVELTIDPQLWLRRLSAVLQE